MTWYWYRCPNGDKIVLQSSAPSNLGTCPWCQADWVRMTEKEIAFMEVKIRHREELQAVP